MHLRVQLFQNYALTPPIFSPSADLFPHKLVPNSSKFKSGFCNPLKRVSESQNSSRNFGCFCFNSSNSGFFNSVKRVSKLQGNFTSVKCVMGLQEKGDDYDDEYYMRRAVELARKGIGCTSPNPMVGCVIVKDGEIVGEGFHPKAGQPHAEVFALRDAGDLAENATAYVSLEPCNHYGRTPPCTEALIKAKVKKVVVGMVDPNPIVASKGVERLKDAGIEVKVGVEEELCKKLNEAYIHKMLSGNPFLTLRYSLSINGHFLNYLSEETTQSGGHYSKLLHEHDAIILCPTNKFQFPYSQEPQANQPLQIILECLQNTTIQLPDFTEASSKVIIFTDKENGSPETLKKIETLVLDKLDVKSVLDYCKEKGLCSVLFDLRGNIEALNKLLYECLSQNLVQKVVIEMLPLWEASDEINRGDSTASIDTIGQRLRLKTLVSKVEGKSVILEGYF